MGVEENESDISSSEKFDDTGMEYSGYINAKRYVITYLKNLYRNTCSITFLSPSLNSNHSDRAENFLTI